MASNDTYCIVPIGYLETLDFSVVRQTSTATCRTSLDGSKAVISWEGEWDDRSRYPSDDIRTGDCYSLALIRQIMATPEWTEEEDLERLTNDLTDDNE
jgi:hypothetical protein